MTNPTFVDKPLDDRLTPEQRLALVRLMEEAAEVQQAAAKVLRFGLQGRGAPHDLGLDNHSALLDEWSECFDAMSRYQGAVDRG